LSEDRVPPISLIPLLARSFWIDRSGTEHVRNPMHVHQLECSGSCLCQGTVFAFRTASAH
jgi:hypothetical protein